MKNTERPASREAATFDDYARELHRRSLGQLPPAVHAGLRDARRAALARREGPRMPGWLPAGMAAAALLAMMGSIALQPSADGRAPEAVATRPAKPPGPDPVRDPAALAATDPELALMLDSLEQTPDFYLWLAANDDALPATEHRP